MEINRFATKLQVLCQNKIIKLTRIMSFYATNSTAKTIAIDPACRDDPFYRYQMRQLSLNTVGKGKMIRTFITNLDDVAIDLKIPPSYLVNYIGQKIGAQSSYDETKQKNQRAFLSGSQSTTIVSETTERFLLDFILCYQCTLPELIIKTTKASIPYVQCQSCGWKQRIQDLKLSEKFIKFVTSHLPVTKTLLKNEKVFHEPLINDGKEREEEEWFSDLSSDAVAKRAADMLPTETLKATFQAPIQKNITK